MLHLLTRLRNPRSIAQHRATDPEAVRRRFVPLIIMGVVFLSGLLMITTVFFVPLQPAGQAMVRNYGIMVSLGSMVAGFIFYALDRRILALNVFMAAMVLGLVDIIMDTSGIEAPGVILLLVMPVLATVSVGVIAGWLWTLVIALLLSGFYFADELGLQVDNIMQSANRAIGIYITALVSLIMTMSTVAYYEVNRRRQNRRVREEHELAVFHARHDPLTNLYNRRYLTMMMERQIVQRPEVPFAVLYVDLDKFKPINDQFGHHVGDAMLVAIADRLQESFREQDSCCRIGGDEFCVLLHMAPSDPIEPLVERIAKEIARPIHIEGREHIASASIGYAIYPEDGATCDALLMAADHRMYRAKQASRASSR